MKRKTFAALILAAVATAPASAAPPPAPSAELVVRFEAIEVPKGRILLQLYDNQAAHDDSGTPVRSAAVAVAGQSAVASFAGLAPGRYAIKAFHDIDGDGKLQFNPFGIPLEPFAFSNNAQAEGGPARWQATSFDVPAGRHETRIAIK
jgi:uncharacterized protein (DUF2141 family)